ncbi:DUF397 domain-containing protein [Streptomyces drozdowiczii]|uniref:DUF397 domain-containing protein n=1 Tax=Streptomyces drozdowiczii TaxID=202862 RepID=A0ABY6PWL0_9ACTN|nr:DUF397 domain-containing protein [Streptomyces drozdowiczii]MCX0244051.1 DUF397 domain-containing protein [Streptomyces drozdowiczii]UZK56119.1 DUF397 domain-containing protein [Streptomyces drozdowiczii]
MTESLRWYKSSYSSNGGACVEVATNLATTGAVPVRDSKRPGGPGLTVSTEAFSSFVEGAGTGEFATA